MKKRIIIFASLFASLLPAFAQVPGYCGKRYLIQYNATFAPEINPDTYLTTNSFGSSIPSEIKLNLQHNFAIEYIVARDKTVGLTFGTTKTNFNGDFLSGSGSSGGVFNYDIAASSKIFGVSLKHFEFSKGYSYTPYRYNDYMYFKGMKKYYNPYGGYNSRSSHEGGGGFLAPLGNYTELLLQVIHSNLSPTYQSVITEGHLPEDVKDIKSNLALSVTSGKQLILADRIILNFGLQFGCVLTAIPDAFKQNKDNLTSNQDLMNYYLNKKLTNLFAVNLKLGVGFLGF